jgi:hypothetical protein
MNSIRVPFGFRSKQQRTIKRRTEAHRSLDIAAEIARHDNIIHEFAGAIDGCQNIYFRHHI